MKPASMGSARQSSTTALESCKTSAKCSSTRLLSQSPLALMKITTKPIPTLYYLSLARLRLKVAPFTWRLELLACLFHSIGITSLMQSNDGAQALELLSTEQERQVIVKQTGLDASQRATFDAAVKTLAEIFDDDQEPADSDENYSQLCTAFSIDANSAQKLQAAIAAAKTFIESMNGEAQDSDADPVAEVTRSMRVSNLPIPFAGYLLPLMCFLVLCPHCGNHRASNRTLSKDW
eukprot:m.770137 g.770137  ORF g.770137 m.770137 type:complete len:235 (+) comp59081_c1_seq6:425-1129(+)